MNSLAKTYNTQNFTVLSISFEKANAEIRGKFAFFDEHVKQFVKEIMVGYKEIARALDKSIIRIEDAVMETLSLTPPELAAK